MVRMKILITDTNFSGMLSWNSTHAETRILEDIERVCTKTTQTDKIGNKKFYKYTCPQTNIKIFTDRSTYGFCESSMDNIVPQLTPGFSLDPLNLSLVGLRKGIFYLGENILVKLSGFFNSL